MKKILLFACMISILILGAVRLSGQVSVSIDNSQADPSAGLDVNFDNKGFLPPRVALTAINSSDPITSPAIGLLVYNNANSGTPPNNVIPGYYYWNGTKWISITAPNGTNIGDMLFWNGSQWMNVPVGSNGQVLTMKNGLPTWGGTQLPIISTIPITDITLSTATSGGNVTSDGGSPVIDRGICWSTTINPTTTNSHTTNGSGYGAFVSLLTGLTGNTMYYVRAYATNNIGTSYGNQVTFTTTFIPYNIRLLVIGGGGGGTPSGGSPGTSSGGGGGGAGGYVYNAIYSISNTTPITVTVGSGGSGAFGSQSNGNGSAFGSVTSCGGNLSSYGNSGGNACNGQPGGNGVIYYGGGGGGGYSGVGGNGGSSFGGTGGAGVSNDISGSSIVYCGGGGGGGGTPGTSIGIYGGGGQGAQNGHGNSGGNGKNGIVIIRYTSAAQRGTGGTITTIGGDYIHTFTSSGVFTPY